MTSEPLRIALVQMSCEAEPQSNLEKALTRIGEAAARGAKVICLQELFRSRYFCQSEEARSFVEGVWNADFLLGYGQTEAFGAIGLESRAVTISPCNREWAEASFDRRGRAARAGISGPPNLR